MMFTKDCTIYLKQGGENLYTRYEVRGVHWEDVQGVNFNRTGVEGVDKVSVAIPLEKIDLSGWGTKSNGYILKEIVTDEIADANALKAFVASNNTFTITNVAKCDYSIVIGDHWEVGAK